MYCVLSFWRPIHCLKVRATFSFFGNRICSPISPIYLKSVIRKFNLLSTKIEIKRGVSHFCGLWYFPFLRDNFLNVVFYLYHSFLYSFSFRIHLFLLQVRIKFTAVLKYWPRRSGLILLLTAAQGRSVFSKHRHHSRGETKISWSASQASRKGLIHFSLWSCSRSYSSCSDSWSSASKSRCWNIHRTSPLQDPGKWAAKQ